MHIGGGLPGLCGVSVGVWGQAGCHRAQNRRGKRSVEGGGPATLAGDSSATAAGSRADGDEAVKSDPGARVVVRKSCGIAGSGGSGRPAERNFEVAKLKKGHFLRG